MLLARRGRTCHLYNEQTNKAERLEVIRLPASIMSRMDSADDRRRYPRMLRFRQWVEGFRSYLIWDPKILRHPGRGKHDEIGPSGEYLACVLGRLKDRNRPAFGKLIRRLRRLFPTLSDISVSGKGWGWRTIRLHEAKGNGQKVGFNSQQMGDGVLRLLAITSMLYMERLPTVLTFEEPENGIHPQLIREVVQILRELTQRRCPHRCQVFLTTHSPYVLDEFLDHPEQVYCMERPRPGAGARLFRLSETEQLEIARDAFDGSLGEAWFSGLIGAAAR
jgi:predicted ATPase